MGDEFWKVSLLKKPLVTERFFLIKEYLHLFREYGTDSFSVAPDLFDSKDM